METAVVVLGLLISLGLVIALAGYVLETTFERKQAGQADTSGLGATVVAGGLPLVLAVVALTAYGIKEMSLAGAAHGSPGTAQAAAPAAAPADGLALMEAKGCLGCHALGGKGAVGPGPNLTGIGGRPQIAGVLPMSKDNLVKWIANPPAVKPGTLMPPLPMTDQEREQIADFLLSQK